MSKYRNRKCNDKEQTFDHSTQSFIHLYSFNKSCQDATLYTECFSLNISDIKSMDFTVTRFLMKLFKSSNFNLINEFRYCFKFELPSELLVKKDKFVAKFIASQSLLDYLAIQ